jgi:hypothetical protein
VSDVREVSYEEGREIFERACRRDLGISGEEFLARWDNGEYADDGDPKVMSIWVLLPFIRPVKP